MENRIWLFFVALAGLCWGTYVPLVAQGGKLLKSSYASLLCVGVAYVVIAVVVPVAVLWSRGTMPNLNVAGVTFATLAGTAGALGALCVILATFEFKGPRIYVAPLIFTLAPIVNTIVSLFWHPDKGALSFGMPDEAPHPTFYVGIVLAAIGAGLVLFSKEYGETTHAKKPHAAPAVVAAKPEAPTP